MYVISNHVFHLPCSNTHNWAASRQNQHSGFATSMDPHQPAQTARMRRLVWIHASRKRTLLVLSWRGAFIYFCRDLLLFIILNPLYYRYQCYFYCNLSFSTDFPYSLLTKLSFDYIKRMHICLSDSCSTSLICTSVSVQQVTVNFFSLSLGENIQASCVFQYLAESQSFQVSYLSLWKFNMCTVYQKCRINRGAYIRWLFLPQIYPQALNKYWF
jgi:hypothetical protein